MRIIILNTGGIPIYEQIKEQIKNMIFSGELSECEVLPSIRNLAKDLKISVITTTRAYNDLEQEGYIKSVPGKGFYIMPKNKELIRERFLYEMEEGILMAIKAAKTAGISKDEFICLFNDLAEEEDYE